MKGKVVMVSVLMFLVLISASWAGDKIGVLTEDPDIPFGPFEYSIDVWEGTCEVIKIVNDSAPEENGNTCIMIEAKPGKTWWGIGWRTKDMNGDISAYPYLVCSFKIDGYGSDFYCGVEGVKGYPDHQFSFKVPRKVLQDGQWHQFVFDLSSKSKFLKNARLGFFVMDNDMSIKGKIYIDHVYLSKAKP